MSHISFVIPAYNAAATLKESVDSIFAGNFTPGDEVIIVNDTSTDSTQSVIDTLVVAYAPHIRSLTNVQNKGCPATRNVGILEAVNELIFNLDADNILAPGSITLLKDGLEQQNADLATFAEYHYFITNRTHLTHIWQCNPGWFTLADLFAGHINPGPGGNFLYTKASWERVGKYTELGKGLHEAWGFTLKQLAQGSTMYIVPGSFYFHRHGHESLFVSESKNKAGEQVLLRQMIEPYQSFFTESDWQRMHTDDSWYRTLDSKPINLTTLPLGKNGTMKVTWYGRLVSLKRKLTSLFT